MEIYAVSTGHPERMHTFKWFDEEKYTYDVVVDDKAAAKRVTDACNARRVHVTKERGVLKARMFISNKLVKAKQWYVGVDDNLRVLNRVHPLVYDALKLSHDRRPEQWLRKLSAFKTWRQVYRTPANDELHRFLDELRVECERVGTVYGGFASQENPYFRQAKWGYFRFVKTKLFVMKNNTDVLWGGSDHAHDSFMSAYIVAKYGRVAVNNYVHPAYKMYEVGGLGTRAERKDLEPAMDEMVRAFPGLVARGLGPNTALRFLRHSEASVRKWRMENGWTK